MNAPRERAATLDNEPYTTFFHACAAFALLLASSVGSLVPLLSKYYPPLKVPYSFFVYAKSLGTGVILGVGFIHLLDPAQSLLSKRKIGFLSADASGSVAFAACLGSALLMHSIEAIVSTRYATEIGEDFPSVESDRLVSSPLLSQSSPVSHGGHSHMHAHVSVDVLSEDSIRARVAALMMGFGTSFHSLFIGFTLGTCENTQLFVLVCALCLHQLFEGLALGTKLVESPISVKYECGMAVLFVLSAPLTTLLAVVAMTLMPHSAAFFSFSLTQGLTDGCCAGILMYLGFGLLHNDFFSDMHLLIAESGKKQIGVWMLAYLWGGALIMVLIGIYI